VTSCQVTLLYFVDNVHDKCYMSVHERATRGGMWVRSNLTKLSEILKIPARNFKFLYPTKLSDIVKNYFES
jgi:hypothetical protein